MNSRKRHDIFVTDWQLQIHNINLYFYILFIQNLCQVGGFHPLTPLKSLNKAGREGEGYLQEDKEQNISLVLTAADHLTK